MGADMSKTMRKAVVLFTLFAALALLVGCPQGTTVADINRNPGRYYNKEVAVSGNVVSSFGLLGTGGYELDDGTGTIWVISQGYGIPGKGAHIRVAGTIIQGANVGGRSIGLALRETRRAK